MALTGESSRLHLSSQPEEEGRKVRSEMEVKSLEDFIVGE